MEQRSQETFIRKMMLSLLLGVTFGIIFMMVHQFLITTDNEKLWEIINNLLFQDITQVEGIKAIGIFYIIGQLFLNALQLAIIPLVFVSLTLAICSMNDLAKIGKIAYKTISCFIVFYIIGAVLSGGFAYLLKSIGLFSVSIPITNVNDVSVVDAYNPLSSLINIVPNNIIEAFSSNGNVLSIVFISITLGLCIVQLGDKAQIVKDLLESISSIVQVYLDYLIRRFSPIAIFCMVVRVIAIYGVNYLAPTLTFVASTIIISLILVITIYPIGIYIMTGLNPKIFIKKITKVALFAAATNSSAATLPINRKCCIEELGCSDEISSFVLPTGMTINMNGTTVMHMMAVTFIATSAGIDITPFQLLLTALLSISMSIGTPAIPVAGTMMISAILAGLGMTSELCMMAYALVLAISYIPGMAVITLNVVGDAATNILVNSSEGKLNKKIYNG